MERSITMLNSSTVLTHFSYLVPRLTETPRLLTVEKEREMLNISRDWHASLISRPGNWERDSKSRDPLHSATDNQKLNAVTIQISEEDVKTPI